MAMKRLLTVPPGIELKDANGRPVASAAIDGRRVKRTKADGDRVLAMIDLGAGEAGTWVVFDTYAAYHACVSHEGVNTDAL
jgi:hypothetical protein